MISLCGMMFSAMLGFMGCQGLSAQGGGCLIQQGAWVPVQAPAPASNPSASPVPYR